MKINFPMLFTGLVLCCAAGSTHAQTYNRTIRFNFIGRDSINLALNDQFNLIEDSCASITRYAHMNMQDRVFFGKIRDVSSQDPSLVLTEGAYNRDGHKDGDFTTHYMNGKLQAKGTFKDNKFAGHWEMYYESGAPKLTFDADGDVIKITDAWDEKGVKTVNGGNGAYQSRVDQVVWKGKLVNGLPDGTWKLYSTFNHSNNVMNVETFKNGEFVKGTNTMGSYTSPSRLVLVSPNVLPFVNAEAFNVSQTSCTEARKGNVVDAHLAGEEGEFDRVINKAINEFLTNQLRPPSKVVTTVNAIVDEYGFFAKIAGDHKNDPDYGNGLMNVVRHLPRLRPAMLDGKPVLQRFTLNLNFDPTMGRYNFTYRFLPLEQPQ